MESRAPSPRRAASSLAAAAALSALAAACTGTPQLRVEAARATRSPALVGVCSIFLTIANAGDGDDALVEARADVPGAITELHAVRDGRMVKRDRLVVPAGGVLELKPGGAHVMVFNLPEGVRAGTPFTLHLRFERSGERRTTVTVDGEAPRRGAVEKQQSHAEPRSST